MKIAFGRNRQYFLNDNRKDLLFHYLPTTPGDYIYSSCRKKKANTAAMKMKLTEEENHAGKNGKKNPNTLYSSFKQ